MNPGSPLQPCPDMEGPLAELALGMASGRERAALLRHLQHCPGCQAEEQVVSRVVDALLELAPEAEPPVGFEVGLLDRLGGPPAPGVERDPFGGTRRPSTRLRRFGPRARVAAVAAAVAALAGFGLGWAARPSPTTGSAAPPAAVPAGPVASGVLTANGRRLGEVATYAGAPAWLFVTVSDLWKGSYGATGGSVGCRLTLDDGSVVTVGTFEVTGSYGAWAVPLTVSASRVRAATLTGAQGAVLASASLPR